MNRREFLKLMGVVLGVPCLPVMYKGANNRHVDFDPTKEYSVAMRARVGRTAKAWSTPAGQQQLWRINTMLVRNMEKIVPPQYRNRVTWHKKWFNWGTMPGMAWWYTPQGNAMYSDKFKRPVFDDKDSGLLAVDTAVEDA